MNYAAFSAVLFDLDGVLIDTEDSYTQFWKIIHRKYVSNCPTFCEDIKGNTIIASIQKSMKSDRREQIIKGSIIPSMSQCLKQLIAIAGTSAVGAFFGAPYIGVLTAVGIFATNKILNDRERQIIYDEIDTELKVVDKEIEMALQDGDTKKYRFLLTYQKKLKRERMRIKYGNMAKAKSIPV